MILIYLARRVSSRWEDTPRNVAFVQPYVLSLGELICARAWRYPHDPVYSVDTIGM